MKTKRPELRQPSIILSLVVTMGFAGASFAQQFDKKQAKSDKPFFIYWASNANSPAGSPKDVRFGEHVDSRNNNGVEMLKHSAETRRFICDVLSKHKKQQEEDEFMQMNKRSIIRLGTLAVTLALGMYLGRNGLEKISWINSAEAAGGKVKSPTVAAPDRYVYYPGTEELRPDEIRVIAAGTGMPSARRSQAATCFLVELGNGDKLLFDIGSGSHANLTSLMIPSDFLRKVFITHLHTDHWGDLTSLWAWGLDGRSNRTSGSVGTQRRTRGHGHQVRDRAHAEGLQLGLHDGAVTIAPAPGEIKIQEFDYKGVNKVIYKENGVTIRSWPAIHSGDGPISFSLEWNGYKIVIGGDTAPNQWFVEYAKDADLAIHEAFMTSTHDDGEIRAAGSTGS